MKQETRFGYTALKRCAFEKMKQTFLHGESTSLADLLGVQDIREHYGLSGQLRGTVPLWGNEVLEKMDAYRFISDDAKGSGKCESSAVIEYSTRATSDCSSLSPMTKLNGAFGGRAERDPVAEMCLQ